MKKLYINTHNITGLKYVGTAKDIENRIVGYKRDNTVWSRHLDKYGYDFKTEVLYELESDDKNSLRKFSNICINFSLLNDIHTNPDFANQMVENGKPGSVKKEWRSEESKFKLEEHAKNIMKNMSDKDKEQWLSNVTKASRLSSVAFLNNPDKVLLKSQRISSSKTGGKKTKGIRGDHPKACPIVVDSILYDSIVEAGITLQLGNGALSYRLKSDNYPNYYRKGVK